MDARQAEGLLRAGVRLLERSVLCFRTKHAQVVVLRGAVVRDCER